LKERLDNLSTEIEKIKSRLDEGKGASHLLTRMNDLNDLIRQKEKQASSQEYGSDLPSVTALKKKHANLNQDIEGIDEKIKDFEKKVEESQQDDPER